MESSFLPSDYLAVAILMAIGVATGVVSLFVGRFLRPRRPYDEKLTAYECGNPPTEEPRHRFSVKFYLVAILFVVFDVEAIFLYPWAVSFDRLGLFALVEMVIFIFLLLVGYVYAWKKEALTWER